MEIFEFDEKTVKRNSGYCYIVEFDNGRVKIGRTINILSRMREHKLFAKKSGVYIKNMAITDQHSDFIDNEKKLITMIMASAEHHLGEFFSGVDVHALVSRATDYGIHLKFIKNITFNKKERQPSNKEPFQRITYYLPVSTINEVILESNKSGMTLSTVVKLAIKDYIKSKNT